MSIGVGLDYPMTSEELANYDLCKKFYYLLYESKRNEFHCDYPLSGRYVGIYLPWQTRYNYYIGISEIELYNETAISNGKSCTYSIGISMV